MSRKLKNPLLGLSALLMSACATSDPRTNVSGDLEMPNYETLVKSGDFEVRQYAPYIVAKTEVKADDWDTASREGFRRIGGYIFGGNKQSQEVAMTAPVAVNATSVKTSEKIAMTAPVAVVDNAAQDDADKSYEVSFMMPSEYSLDTLPVPDDSRVQLEQREGTCEAVVVFSGLTTKGTLEESTDRLKAWLSERKLSSEGGRKVYRYNDPFTLPWNRRNEVLFRLDEESCKAIGITRS